MDKNSVLIESEAADMEVDGESSRELIRVWRQEMQGWVLAR